MEARQVRIREPGKGTEANLTAVATELSRPASDQSDLASVPTRRVRFGRKTAAEFKWPKPPSASKAKPKDTAEFQATAEAEAAAANVWHAEQVGR